MLLGAAGRGGVDGPVDGGYEPGEVVFADEVGDARAQQVNDGFFADGARDDDDWRFGVGGRQLTDRLADIDARQVVVAEDDVPVRFGFGQGLG